jgi:hypothetical protein
MMSGYRSNRPPADLRSRIRFWPSTHPQRSERVDDAAGKGMRRFGADQFRDGRGLGDDRDPIHLRCRRCSGDERCGEDGESEGESNESDPHGANRR